MGKSERQNWLYWDDSFAKRDCVLVTAVQEVAVLGLWALVLITVQVCASTPAPPFSSSGYIHLESWPSSELCHRMELMPSPSPFAFSTLFPPPVKLSTTICGANSVPSVAGDIVLGQGLTPGNRRFSMPAGGCVKQWLFYLPLDLTSLV